MFLPRNHFTNGYLSIDYNHPGTWGCSLNCQDPVGTAKSQYPSQYHRWFTCLPLKSVLVISFDDGHHLQRHFGCKGGHHRRQRILMENGDWYLPHFTEQCLSDENNLTFSCNQILFTAKSLFIRTLVPPAFQLNKMTEVSFKSEMLLSNQNL